MIYFVPFDDVGTMCTCEVQVIYEIFSAGWLTAFSIRNWIKDALRKRNVIENFRFCENSCEGCDRSIRIMKNLSKNDFLFWYGNAFIIITKNVQKLCLMKFRRQMHTCFRFEMSH